MLLQKKIFGGHEVDRNETIAFSKNAFPESIEMSQTLIAVSSLTGNTRIIAHALADEIADACYVDLDRDDIEPQQAQMYDPVILCFWCDKGQAPEKMKDFAKTLEGKRIACFATLGGNPESEQSQNWMQKTSQALVDSGKDNRLVATFLCRGKISDAVFDLMTKMAGGTVSPERLAVKTASLTHPDRLDVDNALKTYRQALE